MRRLRSFNHSTIKPWIHTFWAHCSG